MLMIMSATYRVPSDFPDDVDTITVDMAEAWFRDVRTIRRTRNIAIPRFVNALNTAGYSITTEEYKLLEAAPKQSWPHVKEYLLQYCEKVFNKVRVNNSAQSDETAAAMLAILDARTRRNVTHAYMAEELTKRGIPITAAQFRTAEQGIMRAVPYDLVAASCDILGIRIGEWKE